MYDVASCYSLPVFVIGLSSVNFRFGFEPYFKKITFSRLFFNHSNGPMPCRESKFKQASFLFTININKLYFY